MLQFKLIPVLDQMIDYYQRPLNRQRFDEYLKLLIDDTGEDIRLPIGVCNPMAKEHVLHQLLELRSMRAESIMQQAIDYANNHLVDQEHPNPAVFKVALVLADTKGGWTNIYTTDYSSKFDLQALIKRSFCTPIFWSIESLGSETIFQRTLQYICRTVHQLKFPEQKTLQQHISQESFVNSSLEKFTTKQNQLLKLSFYQNFYKKHQDNSYYPMIFTFLYGDKAATDLGYQTLGIEETFVGFKIAHLLT